MITKLRLERFKNFQTAELELGPLTLLVGTNASGKSNLRDAFRFLHGIGRGYTLAEILGEKYGEGGERIWRGIRGGTREVAFYGTETFALEIFFIVQDDTEEREANYRIEVNPGAHGKIRVVYEQLTVKGLEGFVATPAALKHDPLYLNVKFANTAPGSETNGDFVPFVSQQPILAQLIGRSDITSDLFRSAKLSLSTFSGMRFLDLNPEAMRLPSLPGQITLGDRGENLSSVLQSICEDPQRKNTLVQWLQELTPMDAVDFKFLPDQIGRVLVTLIEQSGQETTAYSASDGTLRFLGTLAAVLGPEPARFYFLEELENGIHPTRLHLLLQLIEQRVPQGSIQIVATTHSPQLLRLLSPAALEFASLTYRLEGRADAQIKRILDIPEAQRIIEQHDLARLYESGWLENSVAFLEDEEVTM
jgi:predicted ATPase